MDRPSAFAVETPNSTPRPDLNRGFPIQNDKCMGTGLEAPGTEDPGTRRESKGREPTGGLERYEPSRRETEIQAYGPHSELYGGRFIGVERNHYRAAPRSDKIRQSGQPTLAWPSPDREQPHIRGTGSTD